jgi:DNA helicase-2/ATP-dependent DNA helicase PcrA
MLCSKNKVIVASAGSRKTSFIVEEALKIADQRVLLTTYTNDNVEQIKDYLIQRKGHIPANITVLSWYSFLLQDGAKPYQNYVATRGLVSGIDFLAKPRPFTTKSCDDYYMTKDNNLYRDRVADFICECNRRTSGRVLKRLEKIYRNIFIDELQDLAGFDLELLEMLFSSAIPIITVGDPRQATYTTNNSSKNKRFKKFHIADWIEEKRKTGLVVVEERTDCYRSNQVICDFADALFPHLPKTKSLNSECTGHDGVFFLKEREVLEYVQKHNPTILRHDRRTNTLGLPGLNIGTTKGRTYDRVLIFTTQPMRNYLNTKDIAKAGDLARLYVATTRARFSVGFVVEEVKRGTRQSLDIKEP